MSPVIEHLQQVFMLHRLIDLGLDEGLADTLREEMGITYRNLTDTEIKWLNEVSARLNAERDVDTAIQTGRVKELDDVMQYLAREYRKRFESPLEPQG